MSGENWRIVSLREALDHARGRDFDRDRTDDPPKGWAVSLPDETTWFTDGTAVCIEHQDGYGYSTLTWDSGSTTIAIYTPTTPLAERTPGGDQ